MDTTQRTLDIIGRVSGKDPTSLRPEADLVADLGIDSPKGLQLLVELEERDHLGARDPVEHRLGADHALEARRDGSHRQGTARRADGHRPDGNC